MDWDDLKLFLAVARSGRLAEAAKSIGQDATTVGRRLSRLERALETTLFEKAQSGHVLTERGQALLDHAERMEAAAIDLQTAAGGGLGVLGGLIRISVSEGFGSQIVAPRLRTFLDLHPSIAVDLIASTGFLNPSRREADIAVMLARPKAGPLLTRKLTEYRLGLYAAEDYARSMPQICDIGDLQAHRLIGYVADLIYAPELRYLAELDGRLEASICSSSIVAQAELIAAGAGCGSLACVLDDRSSGVRRLSFWLVVHRDVREIARIDRFIDWLNILILELQPLMLGGGAPTGTKERAIP